MVVRMNAKTFDGTYAENVVIAKGTDPWVEVAGVAVTWPRKDMAPAPDNDCEMCGDEPVSGVFTGMNTVIGIQRCDTCQRFAGDLDAAFAVAQLMDGVVRFAQEPPA